jgi:hypothetical protein
VTAEDPLHLVRVTRLSAPYDGIEQAESDMRAMIDVGNARSLGTRKLLLDLREGPMRNDEGFEEMLGRYRVHFFTRFAAVAILVKTAVGKLQVSRLAKNEHTRTHIFTDEKAALAHLASIRVPSAPPT